MAPPRPTDDPVALSKAQLRSQFRMQREGLADSEYRQHSMRICERLTDLIDPTSGLTLHAYWPLTDRREVDIRPFLGTLEGQDVLVALPRVESTEPGAAPVMQHFPFLGASRLVENRWGVFEPEATEALEAGCFDLVIVPAFGVGRNGHRIGHGRGFYDAFLAETDALRICPIYSSCLTDRVPAEPHDVPMDIVVTESEVIAVSARGRNFMP